MLKDQRGKAEKSVAPLIAATAVISFAAMTFVSLREDMEQETKLAASDPNSYLRGGWRAFSHSHQRGAPYKVLSAAIDKLNKAELMGIIYDSMRVNSNRDVFLFEDTHALVFYKFISIIEISDMIAERNPGKKIISVNNLAQGYSAAQYVFETD